MGDGCETFASEYHYTDVVALAPGDEFLGYLLGSLETVRLEVAGKHTARYVHGDDQIRAVDTRRAPAVTFLRTTQNYDEACYGEELEQKA